MAELRDLVPPLPSYRQEENLEIASVQWVYRSARREGEMSVLDLLDPPKGK